MKLTDAMPAPLQLVSVTSSPYYDVMTTGNDFVITFTQKLDEGSIGLKAGTYVEIEVVATVPAGVDASFDGQTVTNTAYVTVDNPDSNVQNDAQVLISAPLTLSSTVGKTILPATLPGVPGTVVNFDLTGLNTSNSVVDALVIQDPAATASNAFDYLEVTALTNVVFPTGADRVQVDWSPNNGTTWYLGSPAAAAVLTNPAATKAVRLTFSSSTSTKIAAASGGSFRLATKVTDAALGLTSDFLGKNTASSHVRLGGTATVPTTVEAPFSISVARVGATATKSFSPRAVVGGQPTTVTVKGSNGDAFSLSSMTITEPQLGTSSFIEQGITFDSWTTGLEWPTGATSAQVSYLHEASGLSPPRVVTAPNPLPAPAGSEAVLGWVVTFTGLMPQGAYATLAYIATTSTTTAADLTTTNTIAVDVVTALGVTEQARASDSLTRRTARIDTSVRKLISPSTIYAIPGSTAVVSLPADVSGLPSAVPSSTVGADKLVIRDVDPQFWALFNPTAVVATGIPAQSTLTVRYLSGITWTVVPGAAAVAGPGTLSVPIPAGAEGVEFTFEPAGAASLLPPGFNVQPNIRVALRPTVRGTDDPIIPVASLDNTVISEVASRLASPDTVTAEATASITVLPVPPNGPGMLSKTWKTDEVSARSSNQVGITLGWGTGGTGFNNVLIADSATDPSGAGFAVSQTVFEAFNLVSIPGITTAMDPMMKYDAIKSVELYRSGTGWVSTASNPCAPSAGVNRCSGSFPGYTLTTSEQESTIGVRLVVIENPNRVGPTVADPTAPAQGSGVAATVDASRKFDLTFQVRDVRRSDSTVAVLGNTRGALYNVAGELGTVSNTALVAGRDASNVVVRSGTAGDTILILDQPLNAAVTKTWTGGPLGIPPAGTADRFFPSAQLVLKATNTSVVRVNQLTILEPAGATNPFDFVNVQKIVSVTVPSGATANLSRVFLTNSGGTASHTIADAIALTPTQLDDVTSIRIVHTGRIATNGNTIVTVDTQLRAFQRGTTIPVTTAISPLVNTVEASVIDPGGVTPPISGTDNVETRQATASTTVEAGTFGVTGLKNIVADTEATAGAPAIAYDGSPRTAKITLTGQPSGNIRTTKLVFEDTSPSFWNAFNFSVFGPGGLTPQTPANLVRVDALLGVVYTVGTNNSITATCGGLPDLSLCWKMGTAASTLTLPVLGSGVTNADIRGLRFTYTRTSTGDNWERPTNPRQTAIFTVSRRDTLVAANPDAANTIVPSTLHGLPIAPGETTHGTYTNDMTVMASAGDVTDPNPVWSARATDSKKILYQHLPAKVKITKSPVGAQTIGIEIPYSITVKNEGSTRDRPLGRLVVTDLIPVDALGAQLVLGNDQDGIPNTLASRLIYKLTNAAGVVQPAPDIAAALGPVEPDGQKLSLTLTGPSALPLGHTLTIGVKLQLRPQLTSAVKVINAATVTSDQLFDSCESTTDATTVNPIGTFVSACTSTTTVWALASASLTIVKGVRGVDAGPLDATGNPLVDGDGMKFNDLGVLKTVSESRVDCSAPNFSSTPSGTNQYYRFPCVPITRPGGTEEWVASFTNGGNIPAVTLSAIDVLPHPNDRGVIVNEARNSTWTPILTTLPTLVRGPSDAVLIVKYIARQGIATSRCNATDIQVELGMTADSVPPVSNPTCLTGAAPDDIGKRNWQLLTQTAIDADPGLLASIVALKFVVTSSTGLAPGDQISVVYRSKTAAAPRLAGNIAGGAAVAYNSIAASALGNNAGTLTAGRFVIEPRKVGVGLATGGVQLEKLVDGTNASARFIQNKFPITLTCTSVGESFDLVRPDGASRNPFTITSGESPTLIDGLPLYATCAVSEADHGSVQTVAPATLTAQAGQVDPGNVYNAHPPFDGGGAASRPPTEKSTITNTYNLASLVVGKTVGINAAVDSSGNPVAYRNFTYRVDCTFFNGVSTTKVVDNLRFTLQKDETRIITDLPEFSSCIVEETAARGATSTTHTDTVGNTVTGPTPGTKTTLVLAADSLPKTPTNRVQFTNDFGVGSLTLTKTFTGLAERDYAEGAVTVAVSCTLDTGAGQAIVREETLTLSKASGLTSVINNIAAGAVCAITEPNSAGATSVTLPDDATIIAGGTVGRTIANTFDYAQLAITKSVFTDAVNRSGERVILDSPFTISVGCTFQGRTVYAAGFDAKNPMTVSVVDRGSATLTGLPSGADCTVTEGKPVNADSTDIRYFTTATPDGTTVQGYKARLTLTRNDAKGAGTNRVEVNNRYGVSSFTVTKKLKGGGAKQAGAGPFVVRVTCVAPGGVTAYDGDLTLSPVTTMSVTIDDIATNSICAIAEAEAEPTSTRADAVVYRDAQGRVFDGTGINVTTDGPGATIENWYLTGEVEVTKTVTGKAAPQWGAGPFEVTLECTRAGKRVVFDQASQTIVDKKTVSFRLIPSGSSCLLIESDQAGASSSIISRGGTRETSDGTDGYAFTVTTDARKLVDNQPQAPFTITNDFPLATLQITKTVNSDAVTQNGVGVSYGPFPVTVSCDFNGKPAFAHDYDGDDRPMKYSLPAGKSWKLTGLPQGATCSITEDSLGAVDPYIVVVAGSAAKTRTEGVTAKLTLADVTSVEFVNPFAVGSLELSKVLEGAGADVWGTEPFGVSVGCTLNDSSGKREVWSKDYVFQVVDGAMVPTSVLIETLPVGSACVITETKTGAATVTAITMGGRVTEGVTVTAVIGVDPTGVILTNTFDESVIDVSKVRTGSGVELYGDGPFQVSLTCTRDVDDRLAVPVEIPGGATRWLTKDSLPLAYVASYTGLPSGADCTIVETRDGAADSSAVAPAGSFAIGARPTPVTVTNRFGDPTVNVTKAVLGDGAALYGAGPFEVTLQCWRDFTGTPVPVVIPGGATRQLTAENGYRNSFTLLPSFADCTLAETKTSGATSSSIPLPSFRLGGEGTTTERRLANTFELASLSLTKRIVGTAASAYTGEKFTVALACAQRIDGEMRSLPEIPGGAERTISAGQTIIYRDLPAQAECTLSEPGNGGANSMMLSYNGLPQFTTTFTLGIGESTMILSNVFSLVLTGFDTQSWAFLAVSLLFAGAFVTFLARSRRKNAAH